MHSSHARREGDAVGALDCDPEKVVPGWVVPGCRTRALHVYGPYLPKVRGGYPALLAVLAVDRCSSGFLITGPCTVHCVAPMHGGPIKSSPQLGAPKIRYRVLCLFE